MKSSRMSRKQRASIASKLLLRMYGHPVNEGCKDPIDTLVQTILSQNTTDANSHKTFEALKQKYPHWVQLMSADVKEVADVIRSGGLAELKAERIREALRYVKRECGDLNLDFLRHKPPEEADQWLSGIKGVGPKTRAIVMLFSLGLPAFPVDTHVHRVSKRLGLVSQKTSREKAQEELAVLIPRKEYYSFHINLIRHGRNVCKALRPLCGMCEIRYLCKYYAGGHRGED